MTAKARTLRFLDGGLHLQAPRVLRLLLIPRGARDDSKTRPQDYGYSSVAREGLGVRLGGWVLKAEGGACWAGYWAGVVVEEII
jgi:hypothetical protein